MGPFLIRQISGFEVSFSYGASRWRVFRDATTWQFFVTFYLWEGFTLVLDSIRFYFGNIPRVLAASLLGFAAYVAHKSTTPIAAASGLRWMPGLGFGFLGLMTWLISAIALDVVLFFMLPGAGEEFRRILYFRIPSTVFVLLGTTFFVHRLHTRGLVSRPGLCGILIALLASNVVAIPIHDRIGRVGFPVPYRDATPIMMKALKELVRLPRPTVIEKQYDFSRNARTPLRKALRTGPDYPEIRSDQDYLNSSHFYNFLRSQYGLPFVQE